MKNILVALCLTVLATAVIAKHRKPDDKVKIAVYYESLCPDSKKFIVNQLAPVWHDLRGTVKVKLVPYGKATHDKVNGSWQFTCQHGPDECYGNKVQSCLLKNKSIADTDKVDLIVCLMGQTSPDKSLNTCAQEKKLNAEVLTAITECSNSEQGSQLLAANGDKSNLIQKPLANVPTIVINEKFDQVNQDEAVTNLRAVVCRHAVKKPTICN